MESTEKILLCACCILSIFGMVCKVWWKRMFKIIPAISPRKTWASVIISSVTIICLLCVIISGYIWIKSDATTIEKNFWNLELMNRDMEKRVDSTMRSLSSIRFHSFISFQKEVPGRIYILYAIEEEKLYKQIEKIFGIDHEGFKKLQGWILDEENTCVKEKSTMLHHIKDLQSTNNAVIYKMLDMFIQEKIGDLAEEYRKERLQFDIHIKATKGLISRIARPFTYATEDFTKRLLTSSEDKNWQFIVIYTIPALILIYALCMESIHNLLLSHVQVEQELSKYLAISFYLCSIQTIGLISFEIYLFESTKCQPDGPFHLQDMKLPSFGGSSTRMASEAFARCNQPGENFFLASSDGVFMSYESIFLTNVVEKYVDGVEQFFDHEKILEPVFLSHNKILNSMNDLMLLWEFGCPNDYEHYREFLNQTMNNLDGFLTLKFDGRSEIIGKARTVINNGMPRLTKFLHEPVRKFNDSLREMNFDCNAIYQAYHADFEKTCHPLNHKPIELLKWSIIIGSFLCALMHLLNFRRTDFSQFYKHPKVVWANKHLFYWNEDEKNVEWKSTNNRSPEGATYKNFKRNKKKNRYTDVKCIDATRVILRNHSTDYIHANWINLPDSTETFICTQAPLPNTFCDFWHMVSQEEVKVIVQLCGFIENDIRIAHLYFPYSVGDEKTYGNFKIKCTKIESAPKLEGVWKTFARTLEIVRKNDPEAVPQIVKHVWIHNVFDEQVPRDTRRMIFLHEWAQKFNDGHSPIVALCDTGSGRSATFVSIAYAKNLLDQDRLENISDVMREMSRMRWGAIDSFLEFLFLHATVGQLLIDQNFLHFEDCEKFFIKYRRFWNDRIGMVARIRGNAQIQTHFWKEENDPDFFTESENKKKAKKRITYERMFKKRGKK